MVGGAVFSKSARATSRARNGKTVCRRRGSESWTSVSVLFRQALMACMVRRKTENGGCQGAAGAQLAVLRSVVGAVSGGSRSPRQDGASREPAGGCCRTGGDPRPGSGIARHRAAAAGSAMVSVHPTLLGRLRGTATGLAPVRAQLARARALAAAATGSAPATLLAPLVPVRGSAGVAVGGSQLEGVFGVVMRQLARTPGTRLVVVSKEVRTLAVDSEVRVVASPRERRVLVPAVEQRTFAVRPETRSIAA